MFTIDKVLNANIGDLSNKIKVEFKRTVKVKQYETEAVSVAVEMDVEHMDGMDRVMVYTLLEVQAEYTAISNLTLKGLISQQEYEDRVRALEAYVNQMSAKYMACTGKDPEPIYTKLFVPNNSGAAYVQQQVSEMPRANTDNAGNLNGAIPFMGGMNTEAHVGAVNSETVVQQPAQQTVQQVPELPHTAQPFGANSIGNPGMPAPYSVSTPNQAQQMPVNVNQVPNTQSTGAAQAVNQNSTNNVGANTKYVQPTAKQKWNPFFNN